MKEWKVTPRGSDVIMNTNKTKQNKNFDGIKFNGRDERKDRKAGEKWDVMNKKKGKVHGIKE